MFQTNEFKLYNGIIREPCNDMLLMRNMVSWGTFQSLAHPPFSTVIFSYMGASLSVLRTDFRLLKIFEDGSETGKKLPFPFLDYRIRRMLLRIVLKRTAFFNIPSKILV